MTGTAWEHLPVIDWELGSRLAGNHLDLANDMLAMLTSRLPVDIHAINQHHLEKNYVELQAQVHKLHGAVAYCGTPRLKAVVAHIDQNLKQQLINHLSLLIEHLNIEVNTLLQEYNK